MVSSQRDHTDYWFGRLSRVLKASANWIDLRGFLALSEHDGLELCPFQYQAAIYKPKALGASFGYGYNFHLAEG